MISGYTISRDCISHDYCIEECIRSMLQFCDEVVVGDAKSNDGTRELILSLADETGGRVRLVDYPRREDIFNEKDFVCRWMNATRDQLKGDYQFYLDADEVAGPGTGNALIRGRARGKALMFRRLNFWTDTMSLVPSGVCLSDHVVRSGPTSMWMPADAPTCPRDGEWCPIREEGGVDIFHYGFLRKQDAFARKAKFFLPALIGMHDERVQTAVGEGKDWRESCGWPDRKLGQFTGPHPKAALQWLRDRGYNPRTEP